MRGGIMTMIIIKNCKPPSNSSVWWGIFLFVLLTQNVLLVSSHSEPSRKERSPRKITTEVTKDVELRCPVSLRLPQVEWYKENPNGLGKKRITQFRNRYELSSHGVITIRFVTEEDEGVYVCKSSNKPDSYKIRLEVNSQRSTKSNDLKASSSIKKNSNHHHEPYSEPQIALSLLPNQKTTLVPRGYPLLLLKCESSGYPQPTITWYKDGNIISSSRTTTSPMKLVNVSQNDAGKYRCESVNIFGVSTYEIVVQVTDNWFGAAEIQELSPRNVTVHVGGTVNISCIAKFEMPPWFAWVRQVPNDKTDNNNVFFHSDTSAFYQVLKNGIVKEIREGLFSTELILSNVTKEDDGKYFCAVAGLQGYNLSDATVIVAPEQGPNFSFIGENVGAGWAILWTISFILLVMSVIICFARLYGCRPSKPFRKPSASSTDKSQCNLPERSPLTLSTHCTTHNSSYVGGLMTQGKLADNDQGGVGGGGSFTSSRSGLSNFPDGFDFDSDYDSVSTLNHPPRGRIYPSHPPPSLSSEIGGGGGGGGDSADEYYHNRTGLTLTPSSITYNNNKPNSICSAYFYQCSSNGSYGRSPHYRKVAEDMHYSPHHHHHHPYHYSNAPSSPIRDYEGGSPHPHYYPQNLSDHVTPASSANRLSANNRPSSSHSSSVDPTTGTHHNNSVVSL